MPQATCSLGMCHGRHTQTGMEFSSAISYTYALGFSSLVVQLIVFNNIIIYVIGFVKIDPNHTGTEIHFIVEH